MLLPPFYITILCVPITPFFPFLLMKTWKERAQSDLQTLNAGGYLASDSWALYRMVHVENGNSWDEAIACTFIESIIEITLSTLKKCSRMQSKFMRNQEKEKKDERNADTFGEQPSHAMKLSYH